MKSTDALKLLDAGFTKDEILAMDKPAEEEPKAKTSNNEEIAKLIAQATEGKKEEKPAEETPSELDTIKKLLSGIDVSKLGKPAEEQPKPETNNVTLSAEQFKQLLQTTNLANASIDLPKEESWKDAFNKHCNELLGGTSEQEV
jgi:hypothetical protein